MNHAAVTPLVEKHIQVEALADLINEEEHVQAAKFSDRKLNLNSKKVVAALQRLKSKVLMHIEGHSKTVMRNTSYTIAERDSRMESLLSISKEVNGSFTAWLQSSNSLQNILERNYASYAVVEALANHASEKRKKRIEHLQIEAVREEAELKKVDRILFL